MLGSLTFPLLREFICYRPRVFPEPEFSTPELWAIAKVEVEFVGEMCLTLSGFDDRITFDESNVSKFARIFSNLTPGGY